MSEGARWRWQADRELDVHVPEHLSGADPAAQVAAAAGYRALELPEDSGPLVAAPAAAPSDADVAAWAASTAGVELTVVSADLARVSDEYGSFRSRARRQLSQERTRGRIDVVSALLDSLDAFDAALSAPTPPSAQSMAVLARSFASALTGLGVSKFGEAGQPFDPERHEAVSRLPGNPDAPQVVQVFRCGYTVDGALLRPAMVAVAG